jgi:outer membrane protein TolC
MSIRGIVAVCAAAVGSTAAVASAGAAASTAAATSTTAVASTASAPTDVPARSSDAEVDTVDLDQCVRAAVAASSELRRAGERWLVAMARADRAQANRLPVVSAQSSYRYASEFSSFDLPLPPPLPERSIEFGDRHQVDVFLGVETPLFTGGSLAGTARAEEAEVRASRFDLAADSLRLVHDVRATFFEALDAEAQADAAEIARRRLERHLEELEREIAIGTATEEARLQTQARLQELEQRVIVARERAEVTCLTLGRRIGTPGSSIAPRGDLERSLLEGVDPEAGSVDGRPELAALANRSERSERQADAARGALWPSVMAGARVNYGRPGVDPVENDWMTWTSASLQVSWTLWDWGGRRREADAARAAARAVAAERETVRRDLESAWSAAGTHLSAARARLVAAENRLVLERRRLDLVTGRYRRASASESDLLDVHDDLEDAEVSVVSARAAVRIAEVELLYVAGR